MDCGITEERFWDMTVTEVYRAARSAARVQRQQIQIRATYDYILANLITKGVSKVLGDKANYPTLEEAYPGVFDDITEKQREKKQEQVMNLSALRFKQFAQSYNQRLKQGGAKEDK